MDRRISAAEAKDRLTDLVGEVSSEGTHIIIESDGHPLAALVPISDVTGRSDQRSEASQPRGAIALVGAWPDVDDQDIDDLVRHIYAERAADAERERAGTPLADADLRIASIALVTGLTLVTGNVRHFRRVPSLIVENWLV